MALGIAPSSTASIYENRDLSPYQRNIYALRAPESKRQYPKRLQIFLVYLKIGSVNLRNFSIIPAINDKKNFYKFL
jgi:hypothetical protein